MKRLVCVIISIGILLVACGEEKNIANIESETLLTEDMENNINDIDCESVINTLKDGGIPITYFIIYDDNTDPNVLEYGERKSLYLQKANFVDDRIEKDYDKMKPLSGTVEVFSNKEDALERQGALKRSRDDKFAFRIISDNVLIRLSEEYTKEQAQEIADIAGGEIYSIDKDVDAREKFGDKLDPFQGELILTNCIMKTMGIRLQMKITMLTN